MAKNQQETHLNRARASLSQALSWYGNLRKPGTASSNPELASFVKPELELLTSTLNKLDYNVIRIAAFGLVSRGKSAVLNALLGQKILQTGPLNGVTQYPRSVRWTPGAADARAPSATARSCRPTAPSPRTPCWEVRVP